MGQAMQPWMQQPVPRTEPAANLRMLSVELAGTCGGARRTVALEPGVTVLLCRDAAQCRDALEQIAAGIAVGMLVGPKTLRRVPGPRGHAVRTVWRARVGGEGGEEVEWRSRRSRQGKRSVEHEAWEDAIERYGVWHPRGGRPLAVWVEGGAACEGGCNQPWGGKERWMEEYEGTLEPPQAEGALWHWAMRMNASDEVNAKYGQHVWGWGHRALEAAAKAAPGVAEARWCYGPRWPELRLEGGAWTPWGDLPDGVRWLFGGCAAIARHAVWANDSWLEDPLAMSDGLVLVDRPGRGLPGEVRSAVVAGIAAMVPNAQVVVATDDERVARSAGPRAVRVIEA